MSVPKERSEPSIAATQHAKVRQCLLIEKAVRDLTAIQRLKRLCPYARIPELGGIPFVSLTTPKRVPSTARHAHV